MVNRFDPASAADLGTAEQALLARRRAVLGDIYPLFYQRPIHVVRGEGARLFDADGHEYLDAYNNVLAVGHGNPRVAQAVAGQLARMNTHTRYLQDGVVEYAERFLETYPAHLDRVIFTNSGSEANDTAIKLLWYWANALGKPDKKKIISRQRAYHGVTIGSASLTGMPHVHGGFDLPLDGFLHLSAPHFYREGKPGETEDAFSTRLADELDTLIRREGAHTIAAMFAEPLMGAGGVIAPPAGYWPKMQAVLRKHDIPLVADEVICGFGRLGRMFGSEYYGITPDIMIFSKQLSSAYLPISAVMINERIYRPVAEESERRMTFGHGFTASGHPVAAAVALENLAIIEERGLVERARVLGERMHARLAELAAHPLVGEVRGAGLIGAIELVMSKEDKSPLETPGRLGTLASEALARQHVITRNIGDAIALCPPLIISESELDELLNRVHAALDDVAQQVKP